MTPCLHGPVAGVVLLVIAAILLLVAALIAHSATQLWLKGRK
jgi:hypothetical protein